jgi:hypothetical protein
MKTSSLVTVIGLSVLGLSAFARPAAADGTITVMKGKGARAEFTSTAGCIDTNVTAFFDDDATREIPGSTARIKVAVLRVEQIYNTDNDGPGNPCPPVSNPVVQDSSVLIENPNVSIDRYLRTARLTGTASLFDVTTASFRTMSFDITWNHVSPITLTVNAGESTQGDFTVYSASVEAQRLARATGYVQEGAVNYTPVAAENADTTIHRILSGDVTVETP